jgi:hypothetical protein
VPVASGEIRNAASVATWSIAASKVRPIRVPELVSALMSPFAALAPQSSPITEAITSCWTTGTSPLVTPSAPLTARRVTDGAVWVVNETRQSTVSTLPSAKAVPAGTWTT